MLLVFEQYHTAVLIEDAVLIEEIRYIELNSGCEVFIFSYKML